MAMTAQEALGILDQAAGAAPLSREQHVLVQQAVATLRPLAKKAMEDAPPPAAPEKRQQRRARSRKGGS